MTDAEAKKIAEAIAIALVKREQEHSIGSIKLQCVEILTADSAAPVEKEYRAGEWVPQDQEFYCSLGNDGSVLKYFWFSTGR